MTASAHEIGAVRAWLLAIRPRTLPAAVAPVVVGTGMASARGVADPWPAIAALVGALLLQIATNLANDYFDFVKGSDTEERIGPVRVVQAGILSPAAVRRATALTLALAATVGAYLVWVGGIPILVIGLAALLCAVAYTGGPFPLAYHGLGDLFVFVFFGPVAVAGTYWVQARSFDPDLLLAGAGIGALITAILVVNNLRDRKTDAETGKRTLAVRLGDTGSQVQYVGLVGVGLLAPMVGVFAFGWHLWTLGALGVVVLLGRPLSRVLTFLDPIELNPALGETARAVAWYGGLLAAGFVLGAGWGGGAH
ncbi:MAG: 1,4-dihydroxy-2-naphthoate polyprenyltransferase [Gemmatimonadales bacterium]|nr:MAG: 1,4-dihydroxy-2-naphthoate polyprenyltransferase [Gemmatimonadales bacterium]